MLTNYDAHEMVSYKYIFCEHNDGVLLNYDFVSIIVCEHYSVYINWEFVGIAICEHDKFVLITYEFCEHHNLWAW